MLGVSHSSALRTEVHVLGCMAPSVYDCNDLQALGVLYSCEHPCVAIFKFNEVDRAQSNGSTMRNLASFHIEKYLNLNSKSEILNSYKKKLLTGSKISIKKLKAKNN